MKKIVIMGAAGRDFHNFNMIFREDAGSRVVAFTAAQIPFIEDRTYPPELAGPLYPEGVPIRPEGELPEIIKREFIDTVVFSYSDVSYDYVMHRVSLVNALGADFVLLGSEKTMLRSSRPVVSVTAVRTGCGKSGVSRYIAGVLSGLGRKAVVIRHPMPYGDLLKARVQRFSTPEDIRKAGCTIEEAEEYEPLVASGITVYAGVDYSAILREAEREARVIVWDGGNNDLPFVWPDLEIVVADPLRPGHELGFHPGETNLRRADAVVINKARGASAASLKQVKESIRSVNPGAAVILTDSKVTVDGPIKGKKVLVVEDGPTLTHGGMAYGAGTVAAKAAGAERVEVEKYAVGTVKEVLENYPHLRGILPAVGYSPEQIKDLEETVNATPCDAVLVATPVDLSRIISIKRPSVRVRYEIEEMEEPGLKGLVTEFMKRVD